jgi:hypothetical protein
MGFMTEISILNDRWDEIRKNAGEFVEQIYMSSMTNGREPQYIIGQTTVERTHHADDVRVYFAGRNSFFDAYPEKGMSKGQLEHHLKYLKEMKRYIKLSEDATKAEIIKGEEK